MEERWKDVVNYEGIYQVSDFGNVRNTKTKRLVKQRDKTDNRRATLNKYKQVSLYSNMIITVKQVQRIVAEAFIPNPNNKPLVNHKDNVKRNNTIDNLEWVTASENVLHAFNNGFRDSGNGEKHGYRKLKPEDKKAIKTRYNKRTCTRKELAKEYNVTTASIDRILYL